ncbi:MAG: DUF1990 family protein [Pyrinomonadaceae bacterium]
MISTLLDLNILFSLTKPTLSHIDDFIAAAERLEFSYPNLGVTENTQLSDPELAGYNIDHNRIVIGRGQTDWERARTAIQSWKMFDMPWVEVSRPQTPIRKDENVAVLILHFGFYSLNAARIVYTIDEPGRFGFAYGTLEDHGESGEERFLVDLDPITGQVSYDLLAFSTPNHFLARLGYPLTRSLQKRFARHSKEAMLRAVTSI